VNEKPTHVWIFDENRRVYGKDRSEPIWREHWRRREITGETSRSWIVEGYPELKIPKNSKTPQRHLAWSEKELDQLCWLHEHRYRIVRDVESLPAAELIKVASLIGYEPSPPA
jgi:predicted DNA-binding transcriptional regulator AlpA